MRKIFISEMVTVDGYFAGINGNIDWHNVDAEFNRYAASMLKNRPPGCRQYCKSSDFLKSQHLGRRFRHNRRAVKSSLDPKGITL